MGAPRTDPPRRRPWARLGALAALVALAAATPASARFLRAAIALDARGLAAELDRRSADGYRFEAFVAATGFYAALVSCDDETCRDDRRYAYAALDSGAAGELAPLVERGFRFRAASAEGGRPLFLFERDARAQPAPVEMRWLPLAHPALDLEAVAAAREEGFRVVAAEVERRDRVLLLLERAAGERGEPREVRRLADHPAPLVAALDRAAAEGFSLDAMWSRRPGGSPFTLELNALVSRPRAPRPARAPFVVVTDRYEVGDQGRLVGALEWSDRRALFFQEVVGWDYDSEERDLPEGATFSIFALQGALEEALRQSPFDPVVAAWLERKGAGGWRLVMICEDERPRGALDAEPVSATGRGRPELVPAPALALPPGAMPLGAGGGEPGAAWLAWSRALERRELAAAQAAMSRHLRSVFDLACRVASIRDRPSERTQKKVLGEWFGALPLGATVVGGYVQGDTARLRLLGPPAGRPQATPLLHEVEMTLEEGSWKAVGAPVLLGLPETP